MSERRNPITARVTNEQYVNLHDMKRHLGFRTLDETISFMLDHTYECLTRPGTEIDAATYARPRA